jgi:L-alanine-DL-glutamate epimerase-like enolase superfamily enzyme
VAALELALWDLNAKLADEPAWKTIAAHFGVEASARMPVYAAGGYYYPEDNLGRLQDEMRGYAAMGYEKFKMKIGGASLAEDMRRIEAALEVVGKAEDLAVDANGRFDIPTALDYGRAMQDFGLRWYEEPGDPLDYRLMSELAAVYPHRLATGENLFSCRDVDNLALFGGMRKDKDLFQMDPALSYGLGEFARMVASLEAKGYLRRDVHPHGGHMIAMHIVVGLGLGGSEAYPGVFAPVGGYTDECTVAEGGVAPGSSAGFGLEAKPDLAKHIAALVA